MFKLLVLLTLQFVFGTNSLEVEENELDSTHVEEVIEEHQMISPFANPGPVVGIEPDPNPDTDSYCLR